MIDEIEVTVSFFPYKKMACYVCDATNGCFDVKTKDRATVVCAEHVATYVLMIYATGTVKASA